jgi:hypothetical protein
MNSYFLPAQTGFALLLHGLKAGKASLQTQIIPAKSRVLLFDEHYRHS